MGILVLFAVAALLIAAAISDIRHLRIPNFISIALLLVFLAGWTAGMFRPVTPHLISFAIAAVVGCSLFFSNVWGGGDTKLLAAEAAFLEPGELLAVLLVAALVGGLIAAIIVITSRLSQSEKNAPSQIPYGVALSAGGLGWVASRWVGI